MKTQTCPLCEKKLPIEQFATYSATTETKGVSVLKPVVVCKACVIESQRRYEHLKVARNG
jgi:hypothetical protein